MPIIVSPYHLTTREAPALASFLLADRVVTFLPAPFRTMCPADLAGAADALPRYRKFVESWRWTEPLWTSGSLASTYEGLDPLHDVRTAHAAVTAGHEEPDLLRFMRFGLFEDEREYLDAVAADVLKGGPDPGVSIPVSAGLDRFAARGVIPVARSFSTSLAQRAEDRLGVKLFAFALPIFTQASGDAIVEARELGGERLADLWDAMSDASACVSRHQTAPDTPHVAESIASRFDPKSPGVDAVVRRVLSASDRLAPAMDGILADVGRRADPRDTRCVVSTATITGVALPVDAVIRSSAAAARAFAGAASSNASQPVGASPSDAGIDAHEPSEPPKNLPALADELRGRRLLSLTIKVIGAPTRPRSI